MGQGVEAAGGEVEGAEAGEAGEGGVVRGRGEAAQVVAGEVEAGQLSAPAQRSPRHPAQLKLVVFLSAKQTYIS